VPSLRYASCPERGAQGAAGRALLRLLLERERQCRVDAFVLAEARRNLEVRSAQAVRTRDALCSRICSSHLRELRSLAAPPSATSHGGPKGIGLCRQRRSLSAATRR